MSRMSEIHADLIALDVRPVEDGLAVFRDGIYTTPDDAQRLLIHFRKVAQGSDWFADLAAKMADDLAAAIAETQKPEQQEKAA